jgi:hypothetical protein
VIIMRPEAGWSMDEFVAKLGTSRGANMQNADKATGMTDQEWLMQMHRHLQTALDNILSECPPRERPGLKLDTAFAIGQAAGMISQAKALIGRDIDDAARK